MFGKCLRNYLFNLKYVFSILGVLFLAFLIGSMVFVNGAKASINNMTEQIKAITNNQALSSEEITSEISRGFINEFDGDGILNRGTIDDDGDMLVSGAEVEGSLVDAFTSTISKKVDNFVDNVTKIGAAIAEAIKSILVYAAIFIVIQFVGGVLSYGGTVLAGTTRFDRNPVHIVLAGLINLIGMVAMAALIFILCYENPMIGVVVLIFVPVIYCVLELFVASVAQGKKHKAPMKEVLSIGNVITLFTTNVLALILYVAVGVGVGLISNFTIALYIIVSLYVVSAATVSLNATMICHLTAKAHRESEQLEESSMEDITFTEIE